MKLLLVFFAFLLNFEVSVSEEWSECSRSCGTGISSRTVPCRRFIDDCTGEKKEYRVCKQEECPDNTTDLRTKQCQEHLVSLNDSLDDSCNLMCGLPGGLPVKRVTAMDGTPCSVSGVCIAGTCVPIGCDGILGSEKRMDNCGRCGSTDGVCLHVPCNITKMDEQENVYRVRLPAKSTHIKLHFSSSACNIDILGNKTATNKNQTYSYKETSIVTISGTKLELDANVLTSHGPLHKEISIQIQHCQAHEIECKHYVPVYKYTYTPTIYNGQSFHKHEWVTAESYTACSSTCGNGIQRKEIYCKHIETQLRVVDILCNPKTKPDYHIRNCSIAECPYVWDIGDWGSCSKSCDGGIRKRAVACVLQRNGSVSVSETACSGMKPSHREHCNEHLCYIHWHKGRYSECSNDCGKGQRRRDVFCLNAHGKKINDSHCGLSTKPKVVDRCIGEMCSYRWIRSSWSNCFLEHGIRIQTRELECRRVADNALVNDSICVHNISTPKPKRHRSCPCIKTWVYSEWGKCHTTECNEKGVQYRGVYCYCEDKVTIADGCDTSKKPLTEQPCTPTDPCYSEWVLGPPYGSCSEMCIKVGTLRCMKHNEIVSKDLCPESRPTTLERCGNNCTQCNPDGTCKCVDTDSICKRITADDLVTNEDLQKHCNKNNCCLCKKMST